MNVAGSRSIFGTLAAGEFKRSDTGRGWGREANHRTRGLEDGEHHLRGVATEQAEWLCEYLRLSTFPDGTELRDGFTIRVGWSCSPCPSGWGVSSSASQTMGATRSRRGGRRSPAACECCAAERPRGPRRCRRRAPARFDERVTLARGCSQCPGFTCTGSRPPSQAIRAGTSGRWRGAGANYRPSTSTSLCRSGRHCWRLSLFPVGYIVTFDGDELEGWRNEV